MVDLGEMLVVLVAHTHGDQIGLDPDHELDLAPAVQNTVAHELTDEQDDRAPDRLGRPMHQGRHRRTDAPGGARMATVRR